MGFRCLGVGCQGSVFRGVPVDPPLCELLQVPLAVRGVRHFRDVDPSVRLGQAVAQRGVVEEHHFSSVCAQLCVRRADHVCEQGGSFLMSEVALQVLRFGGVGLVFRECWL